MTYLLIDNSNTRTKFVLSTPDALLPERYMIPTREVSEERLDEVLAGVHYDAAVVCSVVPRVGEVLKNWIGKPCHFLSCDSRLGVGIDYPHPRQIGADRLAAIDPQEPAHAIGTSTVEAMQSGAVYGYRGLVKEILARLEEELGTRPAVVATGGDAALIARGVERIDHVDPDITLNGLRIAAVLNL